MLRLFRLRLNGSLSARVIVGSVVAFATFLMVGCGGSNSQSGMNTPTTSLPANQEVEKTLKLDARVQNFDTDGDKLTVEVNDAFIAAPEGMKERALQRWYGDWASAHAGADGKAGASVQVVVTYDGKDVGKAGAGGIQFSQPSKPSAEGAKS